MDKFSLSHLSDQDLLRGLAALVARDRVTTADLVAHIAEVDERKLFAPKGYPCMHDYCVKELRLSEDAAFKRIRAGRTARQFPAIFRALADGRLHLTAVVLLTPYLTVDNAVELLAAAEHKSKTEIQVLLAERFPQAHAPDRLEPIGTRTSAGASLVPEPVGPLVAGGRESVLVPEPVTPPLARPNVAPMSAGWFLLQAMIPTSARDKLLYIQALLGHTVPTGDLPEVLERSFDAYIALLERQKFAATSRPRAQRGSGDPRHIPAAVKRAVWQRDGGQCGFVGEDGHRCGSRRFLEFDHVDPVARGGEATVDGIRLRCRAHNQYEAECVFGAGFMASKREAAQLAAAEARARAEAARAQAAEERARTVTEKREKAAAEAQAAEAKKADAAAAKARAEAEKDPDRSVIPWLMQLGYRLGEAREAAALCDNMPNATLEERIKAALRQLRLRTGRAA